MIGIFLFIVGICYIGTGINYIISGEPWLGFTFICYALSNIGLYMAGSSI